LLGVSGSPLPTHVKSAGGSGHQVVLPPGASATAQARFTPDVAGTGDSQSGACQPQAHAFTLSAQAPHERVSAGHAQFRAIRLRGLATR
jgi:hypothetical protein